MILFLSLCNCISNHLASVNLASLKIGFLFHYIIPESTHAYNLLRTAINDI